MRRAIQIHSQMGLYSKLNQLLQNGPKDVNVVDTGGSNAETSLLSID